MTARLALALLLVAATAAADPVDLRVSRWPAPRSLKMRVAQAPSATAPPSAAAPARGDVVVAAGRSTIAEIVRPPLDEQVVARIDLGLAVDGARPSGRTDLDGTCVDIDGDGACDCPVGLADCVVGAYAAQYNSVRPYGIGELYLGTRGLGAASLSSYFAAMTRLGAEPPAAMTGDRRIVPALLSPYDETTDFQTRAAWIETDGLFERGALAPLRARAGRMFVYGPAIVHLDGVVLAWERGWLELSGFTGARVPAYRGDLSGSRDADRGDVVSGVDLEADLRRWNLPIVVGAGIVRYLGDDHSELSGTWVPRPSIVVRSSSRFHDGALARQRLVVRARVSEETTIQVDNQLRTEEDWAWDYASVVLDDAAVDPIAARFLDLGPVRRRVQSALIAGTVIAQNVDLLARGGFAKDLDAADDDAFNPHLPDYVEGGVGVELRLRRALGLQSNLLLRDYRRRTAPPRADTAGVADPLPAADLLGEEFLADLSVGARYSGGARRFSAAAELYGRRTRYGKVYAPPPGAPEVVVDAFTQQGGGRFWLEAWINPRIRLRAEYDLTTLLPLQPEFRGLKTLRFGIQGTY